MFLLVIIFFIMFIALYWLLYFNICTNKKNNTIFDNIIFYLLDNKCRDSTQ